MSSILRVFIFTILALCLNPIVDIAQAETNTVRPFAKWRTLDKDLRTKLPQPQNAKLATHPKRYFATATNNPKIPSITPEDTLELIEQLYNNDEPPSSALERSYSKRIIAYH